MPARSGSQAGRRVNSGGIITLTLLRRQEGLLCLSRFNQASDAVR